MSARSGDEQRAQRGENDGKVIDLVERSRHHVEGEQQKVHLTSGASGKLPASSSSFASTRTNRLRGTVDRGGQGSSRDTPGTGTFLTSLDNAFRPLDNSGRR